MKKTTSIIVVVLTMILTSTIGYAQKPPLNSIDSARIAMIELDMWIETNILTQQFYYRDDEHTKHFIVFESLSHIMKWAEEWANKEVTKEYPTKDLTVYARWGEINITIEPMNEWLDNDYFLHVEIEINLGKWYIKRFDHILYKDNQEYSALSGGYYIAQRDFFTNFFAYANILPTVDGIQGNLKLEDATFLK